MEGKDGQVGKIVVNDKGNGFTVDLGELVADTANPNAGKKITVTYTVKVNETTVKNEDAEKIGLYPIRQKLPLGTALIL